jgi:integral membrane sensor domain MASE1
MRPGIRSDVLTCAALAGVYFVAAKAGLALASIHPSATAVWPPTGIALAAVLLLGHRVWPGIFLGAFLANLATSGAVAISTGIATGNTLEALAGAWLVNRFAAGRHAFDRTRDIFRFALLAGLGSTVVSALVGVASLWVGGAAHRAELGGIWLTWWLGDVGGALVVAPLLLLWSAPSVQPWTRLRVLEALGVLTSVALAGQTVFGTALPLSTRNAPLSYMCLPPLVWAAYRLGARETATAAIVLSGFAIWGTIHGMGPFAAGTPNEALLLLQAFLSATTVMALVFAAVVDESRRVEQATRRAEALLSATRLANTVGHEISNALTVIMGQLELLVGPWESDPEARRRVSRILEGVDRIRETVSRMQRLTRLEVADRAGELPELLDLRTSASDDA